MENKLSVEQLDPKTAKRIMDAPLPTKKTLFRRRCIPLQFVRFVAFNLRTLNIVRLSEK
ncbi:hypothetical protein NXS08_06150 [Gleimia sp. 6138-11-ORH1]|uniref:hypothetical protein n=1 Tax=Gleimia sp. 6138-11-ORH1 TaxID=2973937 RepID=UPI0021695EA1|nr:hypothetical protein [Gleimia sp. 6138-11-ORH1]MCS4485049.1 hypothetical protein [Gleimia sp. 6138-11-ORH1]